MADTLQLFGRDQTLGAEAKLASAKSPLAERLRPKNWDEMSGLNEIDPNLLDQLKSGLGRSPSLILWGPPGSGKTTLAKLVGRSYKCSFVELSAVLDGVKEVREIVEVAKKSTAPTVLFVDEIHRFNKAQQDAFLPHVERGTLSLIGATTENPSFYLSGALLSRTKVLVLPALSADALREIAGNALNILEISIEPDALNSLVEYASGDARRILNVLESLAAQSAKRPKKEKLISTSIVQEYFKSDRNFFYDRDGEEHYNIASAFIKSLRGSDPDAALFWGLRMLEGGEDPRFLFRRLMIFAAEDIGNADPRALQLAVSADQAFARLGLPEGKIPLAQCITYLACAPKSNRSYLALKSAEAAVKSQAKVTVPLHLRNAPTKLMSNLGYGQDYAYPHDAASGYVPGIQYLPDELKGQKFYEPSDHGAEKILAERLAKLRQD